MSGAGIVTVKAFKLGAVVEAKMEINGVDVTAVVLQTLLPSAANRLAFRLLPAVDVEICWMLISVLASIAVVEPVNEVAAAETVKKPPAAPLKLAGVVVETPKICGVILL